MVVNNFHASIIHSITVPCSNKHNQLPTPVNGMPASLRMYQCNNPTYHQSGGISVRNIWTTLDGGIHARLRERRLIQFIVPPLAIADIIHNYIFSESFTVSHGQLTCLCNFLKTNPKCVMKISYLLSRAVKQQEHKLLAAAGKAASYNFSYT